MNPSSNYATKIFDAQGNHEYVSCDYPWLGVVNGRSLFCGYTPEHGAELWATDGSRSGTALLTDIRPGSVYSSPSLSQRAFAPLLWQGRVLFNASDSSGNYQLQMSDGSATGVSSLASLYPAATGLIMRSGVVRDDKLIVMAQSGPKGTGWYRFKNNQEFDFAKAYDDKPWALAGSRLMTQALVGSGSTQEKLFVSQYGSNETALLDLPRSSSSNLRNEIVSIGGEFFFSSFDSEGKVQLWRSDGTNDSRRQVILPATWTLDPRHHTSLVKADVWYFVARNDVGKNAIMSIRRSSDSDFSIEQSEQQFDAELEFLASTESQLFLSAKGDETGRELWVMDLQQAEHPSINKPFDISVAANQRSTVQDIELFDGDTIGEALTVRVESNNPSVISNEAVQIAGTGNLRQLTVQSAIAGTALVSLIVSDGQRQMKTAFSVTITEPPKEDKGGGGGTPAFAFSLLLMVLLRKRQLRW